MERLATSYGGTLDKFIGDGVMVLFGDTESKGASKDAIHCVQMAIAMRARFRALSQEWCERADVSPLHIRMGIHTGYCLVGYFGSSRRWNYTALGGAVNIASRLEGLASQDEILMSSDTVRLLDGFVITEPCGLLHLKGVSKPKEVFSLVSLANRQSVQHQSRAVVLR